ncbi:hypothetical protein BCO26_2612 [Heyndrickxia coagulans 2-6]|nr:hypothetical protein BCO26_2612 [Heyndrickxia coagulans 2-6]
MRKKMKVLEHHSNFRADFHYIRFFVGDFFPVNPNPPFCRLLQEIQAAQKGRFAGSGRSDDNDDFPFSDFCCNIF